MDNQHADDGHRSVSQPLWHCYPQKGKESCRAADPGRFEYADPGHGFAPGGNHVGNDHRKREKLFTRKVAAHHEPGNDASQQNAAYRHAQRDHQGIKQRAVEHIGRYGAVKNALPVIQRPFPYRSVRAPGFGRRKLERGHHHLQKRPHHQQCQSNHRNNHQQIIGIRKSVL